DPRHLATAFDALVGAATADDLAALKKLKAHPAAELRALAVRLLPAGVDELSRIASNDASASVRAEALRRIDGPAGLPALLKALGDPDPFVKQAAREGLRGSSTTAQILPLFGHPSAAVRLGALLVLRDAADPADPAVQRGIRAALSDRDPDVLFAGIQWVAEERQMRYGDRLAMLLGETWVAPREFVALLAAFDRLSGRRQDPREEAPGEAYVAKLLAGRDGIISGPLAVRALRMLRPDHPALTEDLLEQFLRDPNPTVQVEAIRTWRSRPGFNRFEVLEPIARDAKAARPARMEAIVGLSLADLGDAARRSALIDLVATNDLPVRREALRALRGAPFTIADSARLERTAPRGDPASAELLDAVGGFDTSRPESPRPLSEWLAALKAPGDPEAGARIFFHPKGPGCYRCHQVGGRGGRSGPELTRAAAALT
ncbi:MAG: hypothetical protein K2X91_06605, partial [Thermoleophilia bacterium]|nr:hypothetical protein [Thermoleophilia bacterium]